MKNTEWMAFALTLALSAASLAPAAYAEPAATEAAAETEDKEAAEEKTEVKAEEKSENTETKETAEKPEAAEKAETAEKPEKTETAKEDKSGQEVQTGRKSKKKQEKKQENKQESKRNGKQKVEEPENAIGKDAAVEKALADAGVTAEQAGEVKTRVAQLHDDTIVYKVSFTYDGQKYSYRINAISGEVVKKSIEAVAEMPAVPEKSGEKDSSSNETPDQKVETEEAGNA